ncbi:S8 family serine peptidase [Candidatus Omnitrophota bacterium]
MIFLVGSPGVSINTIVPDQIPAPQPESSFTADGSGLKVSRTRLIVVFKDGVTLDEAAFIISSINGRIVGGMRLDKSITIEIPESQDMQLLDDTIVELEENPHVLDVYIDLWQNSTFFPNPPADPELAVVEKWLWEDAIDRGWNWGLEFARFPEAWDYNAELAQKIAGGEIERIGVGVINRGFLTHDDLSNLTITPAAPSLILETHGTEVASVMGADFDNQAGIDGANPFINMRGEKTHGTDFTRHLIKKLVNDGVKIIDISMGVLEPADLIKANKNPEDDEKFLKKYLRSVESMRKVANLASDNDVTIMVSAGNESDLGGDIGIVDAKYSYPLNYLAAEEGLENIVIVSSVGRFYAHEGNIQQQKQRSRFSNAGSCVTIAAPGYEVGVATKDNGYRSANGTSYSTPMVTGLVSYLKLMDPDLSPVQIKEFLRETPLSTGRTYVDPISGTNTPIIDAFESIQSLLRSYGWIKHEDNPISELGWSRWPSVIKDCALYKMWFHGPGQVVRYSTSTDGINWAAPQTVLTGGQTGFHSVGEPCVIKDSGIYKMYYYVYYPSGDGASNRNAIAYAESNDGINWTSYGEILRGTAGTWTHDGLQHPWVLKVGSEYHMWFTTDYWYEFNRHSHEIGHAVSANGINWQITPNHVVLPTGSSGEFDDTVIASTCVLYKDGQFHIWYAGNDGTTLRLGHATCGTLPAGGPDNVWVKNEANPVLDLGDTGSFDDQHVCAGTVIDEGDKLTMWYSGISGGSSYIGIATKSD